MLNIISGSIQWRCGVCNSQHSVGTGGICARCRKFACKRHLNAVLTDEKKIRVCNLCLTGEDRAEKGLQEILSLKRFKNLMKKCSGKLFFKGHGD